MEDYILSRLKVSVERRFGKTPITKSDMEFLASDIYLKTKHLVSYNTLRRFFGTVKSTKTSKSVLDFFAEYCGYKSYREFENSNIPDLNFNIWNRLSEFDEIDDSIYSELKQKALLQDPVALSNLFYLFQKFVSIKPVEEWSYFYYNLKLDCHKTTENNILILMANMIGEFLRKNQFSDLELNYLINNQILRENMIYNFVDYSSLFEDGFYSKLIDQFSPTKSEDVVFKYSILALKYFNQNKLEDSIKCIERVIEVKPKEDFFPIINGRIQAATILKEIIENNELGEKTLEKRLDYFRQQDQNNLILYSMEILPLVVQYSPLCEKLEEMMDYIERSTELIVSWNLNLDFTMYYMSRYIYHSRLNEIKKVALYANLMSNKNTLLFYREYVNQLIKKYEK